MIRFKCSNCSAVIHASDEHAGKRMRCGACKSINPIPSRSSITTYGTDFKDLRANQREAFTRQSKLSNTDRLYYWVGSTFVENAGTVLLKSIPLILSVAAWVAIGQPVIPLMTIAAWMLAYLAARTDVTILKALHGLFYHTTVGLTLVLVMFLLLYLNLPPGQIDPPGWFVTLDEYFFKFKTTLEYLGLAFLFIWIILFLLIIYGNQQLVRWRVATRFSRLSEVFGKANTIIFVVTSFTFFTPHVLDAVLEVGLKKQFTYAFRKDDNQKRVGLIYTALIEKLRTQPKPVENFDERVKNDKEVILQLTGTDVANSAITPLGATHSLARNEALSLLASYDPRFERADINILENHGSRDFLYQRIEEVEKQAIEEAEKIWAKKKTASKDWASERHKMTNDMQDEALEELTRNHEKRVVLEELFNEALAGVVPGNIGYLKNVLVDVLNTIATAGTSMEDVLKIIEDIVGQTTKITSGFMSAFNKVFKYRRGEIPLSVEQPEIFSQGLPDLDRGQPTNLNGGRTSVLRTATCQKCGKRVPTSSRVGQRCPHCRVRWISEVKTEELTGINFKVD